MKALDALIGFDELGRVGQHLRIELIHFFPALQGEIPGAFAFRRHGGPFLVRGLVLSRFDRGAQLLVRWHHESWNGSGYPDGLRFEQIPLGARILRVADAYAALTDARPFHAAYSESRAREHLLEWTGLEFDPGVVRALLSLEPAKELQSYARVVEAAPEPMSGLSEPPAVAGG